MIDNQINELPDELVQEARTMGWRPKEEFKGNPEKWVPADEFVEKGRHVMPILLENNKRLQKDLLTRDEKIGTLESQLKEARDAIDRLDKHFTEANKRDIEESKKQLKERLKTAREDNDVDAELEIREQLDKLNKAVDPPAPKQPDKSTPETKLHPSFVAWQKENEWFGGTSPEDKKRTKEVIRIGEDLREEGSTLEGREFLEECVKIYESRNKNGGEGPGKYESGSSRPSGSSARGKTYASLPSEAKASCEDFASSLVGPGKKYATIDEWRKDYAKQYWEGEGN